MKINNRQLRPWVLHVSTFIAAVMFFSVVCLSSYAADTLAKKVKSGKGTQAASTDCAKQKELPASECSALRAFYQATGGRTAWGKSGMWTKSDFPCGWKGVFCEEGHVVELDIARNGLTGAPPKEIAKLTKLRRVNFRWNRITGLPKEIGKLSKLRELYLGRNEIAILPKEIGLLKNLIWLDVGENKLIGLPDELVSLKSLRFLRLAGNKFKKMPTKFGKLTKLERLDANREQLDLLPKGELKKIPKLVVRLAPLNDRVVEKPADKGLEGKPRISARPKS